VQAFTDADKVTATHSAGSGLLIVNLPPVPKKKLSAVANDVRSGLISGLQAPIAGTTGTGIKITDSAAAPYFKGDGNNVVWSPALPPTSHALYGNKFEPNTAYTATFTLAETTTYQLDGALTANFFVPDNTGTSPVPIPVANGNSFIKDTSTTPALLKYADTNNADTATAGSTTTNTLLLPITTAPASPNPSYDKDKKTVTVKFAKTAALVVGSSGNGGGTTALAIPISVPKTGATASTVVGDNKDAAGNVYYSGDVTWIGELDGDKFKPDTAYSAVINLTAKGYYTFAGMTADTFTIKDASVGTATLKHASGSGVVSVSFTNTLPRINDTISLTFPGIDDTPVPSITGPSSSYTAGITWSPNEAKFVAGKTYTAIIDIITDKTKVTLSGVSGNYFKITDTDSKIQSITTSNINETAGTARVTVVYKPLPAPVTDKQFTLAAPVAGNAPTKKITETQFVSDADIAWYEAADVNSFSSAFNGDKFNGEKVYKAVINIKAASGFFLSTTLPTNQFSLSSTVQGATVTYDAPAYNITVVYSKATGTQVVDDLVIQLANPVIGQTSVVTLTPSHGQYTAKVVWSRTSPAESKGTWVDDDDTTQTAQAFVAGKYTAKILLTAATGWRTAGLGKDVFSLFGQLAGTTVTNNAVTGSSDTTKSATITITYPVLTTAVNKVDLVTDAGLVAPANNGTPKTAIAAADSAGQYTGTVAWTNTSDGTAVAGDFTDATGYKARVTLTLIGNSGYATWPALNSIIFGTGKTGTVVSGTTASASVVIDYTW